jgi:lysophospholipase L1-like esterase
MSRSKPGALARLAVLSVLATLVLASAAQAARPPSTYVALGDSLAYGYQAAKFAGQVPNVDPTTFNTGYVDNYAKALNLVRRNLVTVNDGCPGETTDSFINGGPAPGTCATGFPFAWLHHHYGASSQLADALALLSSTPNVTDVTLNLGANDVLRFLRGCGFPSPTPGCITPAAIGTLYGHIAANVGSILAQVRARAPEARIVLLGLYNPYPATLPGGDGLTASLNSTLKSVAAATDTKFADPLPVFNPSTRTGASETTDIPTTCALTAMCPGGTYSPASPLADIHPTNAGYLVLAGVVGYAALGF